ncbi:DUF1648 domain-containing protein [Microbacterium sp. APC 3901]|uniref:DUF1648 domain-containing protein n=1 Tax=Microbacterium sp. APC 3901 TaxID=3035192 RepID=UPI0025B403D7|nr:DUF1648 domain-containing protein [Microbacterium sp. APC 3901]MDN3444627.1 DUF1648 domain-containing protein [Microbacterium sp. APC 3901]
MRTEVSRARTAFWWVGVIVPLALIVLANAVVLAWLPELPDPVATHWGGGGVDGYAPKWMPPVMLAGLGGGIVVLFASIALFSHGSPQRGADASTPQPRWSTTARLLGAVSLGTVGMMSALTVAIVGVQRGLSDAADAADIAPWSPLFLLVAVGLAVAGWFLQPAVERPAEASGTAAQPLPLADHERAVWMRTVTIAKTGQVVLGIGVLVTTTMSALLLARGIAGGWITAAVTLLLVILVSTSLTFRVRASTAGLRVRSAAGWPRLEIPAAQIASTRAVRIDPFAEFGGWGYRFGTDGRRGFVLRAGDALEVTRTDGRVFVVTVDDAATAASVLAAAGHR